MSITSDGERHSEGRPSQRDMNTEEKAGQGGGTGEGEMAFEGGLEGSGNTTLWGQEISTLNLDQDLVKSSF